MSRKQQRILAVLGVAIVLVYGSLGSYALIHLTQGDSTASGGLEQAAGILPSDSGQSMASPTSDAANLSSPAGGAPLPTNTRVIQLDEDVPPPPAPTSTSAAAASPPPVETVQPTRSAPAAPTPPPPVATPTAPVDTPTPPPASPTPAANCVEDENALHQQKLADIEAEYEPMFTWLDAELEHAERIRDEVRLEEIRQERRLFEQLKAADLEEETQRHEAALAACAS